MYAPHLRWRTPRRLSAHRCCTPRVRRHRTTPSSRCWSPIHLHRRSPKELYPEDEKSVKSSALFIRHARRCSPALPRSACGKRLRITLHRSRASLSFSALLLLEPGWWKTGTGGCETFDRVLLDVEAVLLGSGRDLCLATHHQRAPQQRRSQTRIWRPRRLHLRENE